MFSFQKKNSQKFYSINFNNQDLMIFIKINQLNFMLCLIFFKEIKYCYTKLDFNKIIQFF